MKSEPQWETHTHTHTQSLTNVRLLCSCQGILLLLGCSELLYSQGVVPLKQLAHAHTHRVTHYHNWSSDSLRARTFCLK